MSCSRVTAAGHGWEHWQAFSLVRHGHDGGGAEGGDCEDDGRTHGGFVVVVVGWLGDIGPPYIGCNGGLR